MRFNTFISEDSINRTTIVASRIRVVIWGISTFWIFHPVDFQDYGESVQGERLSWQATDPTVILFSSSWLLMHYHSRFSQFIPKPFLWNAIIFILHFALPFIIQTWNNINGRNLLTNIFNNNVAFYMNTKRMQSDCYLVYHE